MTSEVIHGQHFSDVLCVWAYVGQVRIDELCRVHGESIDLDFHFVDIFGDVPGRLTESWKARGGLQAYSEHVQKVVADFDHVRVHPEVWTRHRPMSSQGVHAFLHAVQLVGGREAMTSAAWQIRQAFFEHAQDISSRQCQLALAESMTLDRGKLEELLDSGRAYAHVSRDARLCADLGVKVSPTLLFDDGRQVLKGNVGFRVIDANVQELKHRGRSEHSWC